MHRIEMVAGRAGVPLGLEAHREVPLTVIVGGSTTRMVP
jgi:hypothetical protein